MLGENSVNNKISQMLIKFSLNFYTDSSIRFSLNFISFLSMFIAVLFVFTKSINNKSIFVFSNCSCYSIEIFIIFVLLLCFIFRHVCFKKSIKSIYFSSTLYESICKKRKFYAIREKSYSKFKQQKN